MNLSKSFSNPFTQRALTGTSGDEFQASSACCVKEHFLFFDLYLTSSSDAPLDCCEKKGIIVPCYISLCYSIISPFSCFPNWRVLISGDTINFISLHLHTNFILDLECSFVGHFPIPPIYWASVHHRVEWKGLIVSEFLSGEPKQNHIYFWRFSVLQLLLGIQSTGPD